MGHSLLLSGRRITSAKVIAAAVASVIALAAVLVATGRGPHVALPSAKTAPRSASLPLGAQGAISDALGRDRSAFHVVAGRGGLVAGNSAMGMSASFGARGALVRAGGATFGLRLLGYGAVAPRAHANRVTYRHGAITEWYSNGPLGLEQGFDVKRASAGAAGDLALRLGLSGNVRARATGSNGLTLAGPRRQNLSYSGLSATDARGRTLKSWLSLNGRLAVIHVRTAGAAFPVKVDPYIQVSRSNGSVTSGRLGGFAISVQGSLAAISEEDPSRSNPPQAVDIFAAKSGRWQLGATLIARLTDPADESFGHSVSLTPDGRTLAVGAPDANTDAGAAYVFSEPATGWASTTVGTAAKLTDTSPFPTVSFDQLGQSVSISADGSTIAVGVFGRASSAIDGNVGAVDVYQRSGMNWATQTAPHATLTHGLGRAGDQLGRSVALSGNGSTIVAGATGFGGTTTPFIGEAWVWQQPATGWANNNNPNAVLLSPNAITAANNFFGGSTAISADAKTIVIGATGVAGGRGAAFVYTSPNGVWTSAPNAAATLMSSDGQQEQVGWSVATDGHLVVSGTPFVTIGGNMAQGAAYVYVEPPTGWRNATETQKLFSSDGGTADGLGQSVGLSNGTVLAASPGSDVPGHADAGAIYAFGPFPTTSISFSPAAPNGSNGWYRSAVRVTVGASDTASTVNGLRCAADLAAAPASFLELPAACPFATGATIANSGLHAVYAAASNTAGYANNPVSGTFKIDTNNPTVRCVVSPTFILRGKGGLVAATVSDPTSGAAASLIAGRANVRSTGRKTVTLTGRDNAGNSTTVHCGYQVAAPQVPTSIRFNYSFFRNGTMFTTLTAKKVPKGATLAVICKGGGCPFGRRTLHPPKKIKVCKAHHKHCKIKPAPPFANLDVLPLLNKKHLAPKTKLTLTVTKPNTIGVTQTFTMGKIGKRPKVAGPSCLAPGSNKPGKGCHS